MGSFLVGNALNLRFMQLAAEGTIVEVLFSKSLSFSIDYLQSWWNSSPFDKLFHFLWLNLIIPMVFEEIFSQISRQIFTLSCAGLLSISLKGNSLCYL